MFGIQIPNFDLDGNNNFSLNAYFRFSNFIVIRTIIESRLVMKIYSPESCYDAALFLISEFSSDEGAFELQRGKLMNKLEITRRYFSRIPTPISQNHSMHHPTRSQLGLSWGDWKKASQKLTDIFIYVLQLYLGRYAGADSGFPVGVGANP